MNYTSLSINALTMLHADNTNALAADDAASPNHRQYLCRDYPYWRVWSDQIETELGKRGVAFEPVLW